MDPIDIVKYTLGGVRMVAMTEDDFNALIAEIVLTAQQVFPPSTLPTG